MIVEVDDVNKVETTTERFKKQSQDTEAKGLSKESAEDKLFSA